MLLTFGLIMKKKTSITLNCTYIYVKIVQNIMIKNIFTKFRNFVFILK